MIWVGAGDAADLLGISRQSLADQYEKLEAAGVARRIGRNWKFDPDRLEAVYAEVVAPHGNSPRLGREAATCAGSPEPSTRGKQSTLAEIEAEAVRLGLRTDIPTEDLPPAADSDRRLRYFRAQIMETKHLTIRGELLSKRVVCETSEAWGTTIKNMVLGIPDRCAAVLESVVDRPLNEEERHQVWLGLTQELRNLLTAVADGEWERMLTLAEAASKDEVARLFSGLNL